MSSPTSGVSAVILNGGRSRRMGGADKARLAVGGRQIADTQLGILRRRFAPIAMVVARAEQAEGLDVDVLFDRVGGQGPIDGIASALAWSPNPWVLVLACDMPDVHPALLEALVAAREEGLAIVAPGARGRVQPLLALYHQRLLPTLDARLTAGHLRASELLLKPPAELSVRILSESEVRRADPELQSFRNLNSPKDLSPS